MIGIGVVAFRNKEKKGCKFGVAEQGLDALEDVPEVYFESLASDNYLLPLEPRAGWRQLAVDDFVQLL